MIPYKQQLIDGVIGQSSFAIWDLLNAGSDPFGAPTRAKISAEQAIAILGKCKVPHISLHDIDVGLDPWLTSEPALAARVKELKNNRIVQPHGAFDYLARDIGLEVVAVTQPHGQEPSAAEMLELVRSMREKQAGAVFTEPQYSPKVGQTLAKETGIPTAVLDPVASGPEDAPLDYYETAMRKNLETLRATLGVKP